MRLPSLTLGLSLLVTGTAIGAATQQFASADVSSGDRPVLVPIETCRIADTRPAPNNVGPRTAPLAPGDTMTIDAQEPGTDCTGQIPADASALSLNVTALNATSNSFLTIWPDGPRPTASALNPAPDVRVFNAVTTALATDQTFQVFNNRGTTDLFIDVNGYYENHDHDDRYYTQTEVGAAIDDAITAALADEKMINIGVYRDVDSLASDRRLGHLITRYSASVVLPPDYTAGSDLRFEISLWRGAGTGACTLGLEPDFLDVFRPGIGNLNDDGGATTDGISTPAAVAFPDGFDGVLNQEFTITAPGTLPLQAGDVINIVLNDNDTTCGGARIRGSALYYV